MCKITCFSDFRRPAVLVVGPALVGVWETDSRAPLPRELQWTARPIRRMENQKLGPKSGLWSFLMRTPAVARHFERTPPSPPPPYADGEERCSQVYTARWRVHWCVCRNAPSRARSR